MRNTSLLRPLGRAGVGLALAGAVGLSLIGGPVHADSVSDFYHGKTIEHDVGSGVGGGYDLYARLMARYMVNYIPGKPVIIVKNIVGGGGIRAANLLYNVSPRDGSVIATVSRAMITAPLMGTESAKFDPAKFTWIGAITHETSLCVAWHTAKVKNWDDVLKTKLLVGTAAPGTTTYSLPLMLQRMFGAKFELISGYPDASRTVLAMEREEVDGLCQTYSSLRTQHPTWIKDGTVNVIAVLALERNADLPNAPAAIEFAKNDEQKAILKVVLGPDFAGGPLFAPPGIPADRTRALRDAFNKAMKDPALLADAKKQKFDINPATGEEIAALVNDIQSMPASLIAKVKAVTE